ncbi:glycoside hydrolase family 43 protein [Aquisalinus luteolus]|uniref:Alpha-N-arabinofuranosidase n=2 Tax=Aquisalinus luteolus TaxID=1566827 RepID=A0A8J3A373_9PROT|nr:glycoside hydrolase family 43 protein [Aquisalinus luteolus]GGH99654.1 alpha-N-arabinofuranosidase [Aquisalinus luteolus]
MLKTTLLMTSAILLMAACGETPAPEEDTTPAEDSMEMSETDMASADAGEEELSDAERYELETSGEFTEADYIAQPLVTEIYTADPSVHVWDDGRVYVYPSHDVDTGIPQDDLGSQYDMKDYIVLSMDEPGGEVTIHDVGLHVDDVPWARDKMWAPDAAEKDGKYYLYFPAKDYDGIFRIGVASSDSPTGPFTAEESWIEGSYSMDPSVFEDTDGTYYMYVGGIWGGQLQRWTTGEYDDSPDLNQEDLEADEPALVPYVAKMSDDMLSYAEEPRDVLLLDENGEPLKAGDNDRRFFEAAWVNKINGTYYMSWSTGDTHKIVYGTSDSPYGPFTYQGVVNLPVQGWTNHHSIFEYEGQYYLAYHDTQLSGVNHLRNVKITPLTINDDGTIEPVDPFFGDDVTVENYND